MKKIISGLLVLTAAWTIAPTVAARTFSKQVKQRGPDTPMIALTFDDGPDPLYTPLLLKELKMHGVKATFFVVGEKAKLYPSLIRMIAQDGHEIGLHNHQHFSNWLLPPGQLKNQLKQAARSVTAVTEKPVVYYRPPWGHFSPFTLREAHPFQTVMWTSIPGDWKQSMSAEKLADNLRKARFNGAVITLHDSGTTLGAYEHAPFTMIKALQLFLSDPESKNFDFVTVRTLYRK